MASEYKKRGGGYNEPKSSGQDDSQKHLSEWGEEEWQTKEGSGTAKQGDGSRKRYLPKKAWEEMSEKEKQETEDKKAEGAKKGKQFVGNTETAKQKRSKASKEEHEEFEKKKGQENKSAAGGQAEEKGSSSGAQKRTRTTRSSSKKDADNDNEADEVSQSAKKQRTSEKGGSGKKTTNGTVGSKHDKAEAPGAQGSNERLPNEGQRVHWKAMPGWVKGEVVEILKTNKKVGNKDVKASKEGPRLVLKSDSSGKICVHKPDNLYFD